MPNIITWSYETGADVTDELLRGILTNKLCGIHRLSLACMEPSNGTLIALGGTTYVYNICRIESATDETSIDAIEVVKPIQVIELTSRQLIEKYRNANAFERRDMARMGFELETQSTEGQTWDECTGEVDHDAMCEAADNGANDICDDVYQLLHHVKGDLIDAFKNVTHTKAVEIVKALGITNLSELCESGLTDKDKDNLYESIRENILENMDSSEYMSEASIDDHITMPRNIEAVQDSSVEGFEFRTIGGLTFAQAAKACQQIFEIDHKIDTECSFHVHLSIPGVKHNWGADLQAAMYEYLLTNIDRVPEAVRQRWSDSCTYFQPKLSRDKYTFVHMHSQGTWEFRCFGNVQDSNDGIACMELAMEALQYGYKVLNNEIVLLKDLAELSSDTFSRLCEMSMRETVALPMVIEKYIDDNTEQAA